MPTPSQTRFNSAAETYDDAAWHQNQAAQFLAILSAKLPEPPRTILDLGCGTGLASLALKAHYPDAQLIGCDASEAMLRAYQKRFPDATTLKLDLNAKNSYPSVDCVVSSFALQWVTSEGELFQQLPPKARFLLCEPVAGSLPGLNATFRTTDTIRKALAPRTILAESYHTLTRSYPNTLEALRTFSRLGALEAHHLPVSHVRRLLRTLKPELTYHVTCLLADYRRD